MDRRVHEDGGPRTRSDVERPPEPKIIRVRDPDTEGVFPLLQGYAAEIGEPALEPAGEARVAEAIAADRIRFFVALRDGRPFGICSLTIAWSTFGGGRPFGMLEDFFVSPAHRGSGAARALAERVFAEAGDAGCASVVVGCADSDIPLYRSLGFSTRLGTMLARVLA